MPGIAPAVARSVRKNRWKSSGSSSRRDAHAGVGDHDLDLAVLHRGRSSVTLPFDGVNLIAFETKLSSTCASRARSPWIAGSSPSSAVSAIDLRSADGCAAATRVVRRATFMSTPPLRGVSFPASTCATKSRSPTTAAGAARCGRSSRGSAVCSPVRFVSSLHQLEVAADRGQRCAQLVRDERDELVLQPVELSQLVVLPLELELRLAAGGDVDDEAARMARSPSIDDHARVLDPHDAAVAADHAVLVLERAAALRGAPHLGEHRLVVVGVQHLAENAWFDVHSSGRVRGDRFDLRADPRRAGVVAAGADVRRERQRLDERAVALLGLAQLVLDARDPDRVLGGVDRQGLPQLGRSHMLFIGTEYGRDLPFRRAPSPEG